MILSYYGTPFSTARNPSVQKPGPSANVPLFFWFPNSVYYLPFSHISSKVFYSLPSPSIDS